MAGLTARPLRVLQVIETFGPGGAETVVLRLAEGLRAAGHAVVTAVGREGWLTQALEARALPWEVIPPSARGFDLPWLRALRGAVRRHRPDVVHAHLFGGAVYAALAARLEGVPVVVTLHGEHDLPAPGRALAAKRWLLGRARARLAAVSPTLADSAAEALRWPRTAVAVVPNGVPEPPPAPAPRGAASARRLVALGNIREPKDYPTLLRAVARLRAWPVPLPPFVVDVAGAPDGVGIYEGLLALRAELGVEALVRFAGFVEEAAAFLAGADGYVLSSSREGFSLATVEAMLAGVPVVATRCGGPEALVADGETGVLVPPRDPEALAAAMAALLLDPAAAAARAARARAEARDRHTVGAMVARYVALYVGEPGLPAPHATR